MKTIQTYPAVASPVEGEHRDDMTPERALFECFDLWASGAWDDRNAQYDLEEVMGHVARLLNIPGQSVSSAASTVTPSAS